MKRVIILSPYKGDIEANIQYAWECVIDSLRRHEAPFASHLFYTEVMNDTDPAQRSLGFQCEEAWLRGSELVAVYTDRGLSPGMIKTINLISVSPELLLPIEMRSIK